MTTAEQHEVMVERFFWLCMLAVTGLALAAEFALGMW